MESCNRYHSDHDTYLDAADHHLLAVHRATDRDTFPPRVSQTGMIYGGMYLHHVLIKRYTCWWKVLTEKEGN
mgnify:CR=1 FL=1